jgi:branched-chain amino acid transport system permease protein
MAGPSVNDATPGPEPEDAAPGEDAAPAAPRPLGSPLYPPLAPTVITLRVIFGVLLAAAVLYAPIYFTPQNNRILSQAIYLAVAAMGLNLLTGFNGQISIGHGAFFAVGAFTTAILMVDHNWTFEATIPIAAVLAGTVGLLVGFPALRVRGLYLALVTLGLAVLAPQVANKYVHGTGGRPLLQPRRSEFSSLLTFLDDDQWMYYLCLAIAALLFFVAWNLVRSRVGRAMVACRDEELAASTLGVNLAGTKVGTFAISAVYAGIAGSLSVMVDRLADGTNPVLYFQRSIEFLVAVVIGGAATMFGPIVGAVLLVLLRRNTQDLLEGQKAQVLSPALYGAALMAIVYVLPEGVVGGVRRLVARMARQQPVATAQPPSSPTPEPA